MTHPRGNRDATRTRLPNGFAVRLKSTVRIDDDGAALVGGFPTRALYLTAAARTLLRNRALRVDGPDSAALGRRLLDAGLADPELDLLPPMPDAAVTVVVPAYNRPDALGRLLRSINGRFGVIVVDDASDDPDAIAAVTAAHGADLVRLASNVGPAGARNAGLARVGTPFVALVDSDMVLEPDTVPILLRHFADPCVAVVAPRVLGLAKEHPNWITRYEDARSSLDMGTRASLVRPRSPVSWLPAACLIARTAALGDGFGAEMRVAEDVDLVWRLDAKGWQVRYEPTVHVHHEHRDQLLAWLGRKAFYGTGAELLARRHPQQVSPAILAPWAVVLAGSLLAQRRWSLPVAAGIAGITTVGVRAKLRRNQHPTRLALRLTGQGVVSALFQVIALLLRHWWPATAVACIFFRRARTAALLAAVLDTALEWGRTRPDLDPLRFGLLRRLDDIAYGSGLWLGALRGHSLKALQPSINRRATQARPNAQESS